jgi:hypothetical protein
LHYVCVGDAHNPEAFAGEPFRPSLVIIHLIGMCVAVDLDHQLCLGAKKVGNERAKPDLAPEFETIYLSGTKFTPQAPFGRGRIATCFADAS